MITCHILLPMLCFRPAGRGRERRPGFRSRPFSVWFLERPASCSPSQSFPSSSLTDEPVDTMASAVCRATVGARAAPAPRSVSLRAPRATALLARSPAGAVARRNVVVRAEEAKAAGPETKAEPEV